MATQDFQVIAAGIPAKREEYIEAMRMPLSELPPIENDLVGPRGFTLNPETTRRHAEMRRTAREREERQGLELGFALEKILEHVGSDFRLAKVQRTGNPEGWAVQMLGDSREVHFTVAMETVERLWLGSVTNKEMDIFIDQIAELVEPRKVRNMRV